MKKIIPVILVLCMVFSMTVALTGCKKNDPTVQKPSYADGENTSGSGEKASLDAFKGKLMEPYAKIMATGNYMFEAGADGQNPITVALYGDNTLITMTMQLENKDTLVSFVKMGDKYYIALPTEKVKQSVTKETMENEHQFSQLVNNAKLDNVLSGTFKKEGTIDGDDGKQYKYEDYYVPLATTTYRFIFDENSQLVMFGTQVTGKEMQYANLSFYETSADAFSVIESYQDASTLSASTASQTQSAG